MRKKPLLLIMMLIAVLSLTAFISCDNTTDVATYHVIVKNGDITVKEKYVADGDTFSLPAAPSDDTRTFAGWLFGNILMQPGDEIRIYSDFTFSASWKEKYTVTVMNGKNKVEEESVNAGDSYVLPPRPQDERAFTGWRVQNDGLTNETILQPGEKFTVEYETTISAVWVEYCKVSFDLGYDTSEKLDDVTVSYGEIIQAPSEPVRNGYTFLGWYSNEEKYDFASSPVKSDIILKAHWSAVTCTVTFNTNGGSALPVLKIPYGEKISYAGDLVEPTKSGYTFICWTAVDDFSFSLDDPITKDTTLFAWWNPISYTVTFDLGYETDETIDSITTNYGKTVDAPDVPSRKGYVFSCWKVKNGGVFDFVNPVTSDLELEAVWTPIKLNLTLYFPKNAYDLDILRLSIDGDAYKADLPYDSGTVSGEYLKYTLEISGTLDHGTHAIKLETYRTDGKSETKVGNTYSDSVYMKYDETDKEIKIDVSEFASYSVQVSFKASTVSGDNTSGYVLKGKTTITYDSANVKVLLSTDTSEPSIEYVSGTEIDTTKYTPDETNSTVISVDASPIDSTKWTRLTVTYSDTVIGALGPAGGIIYYDVDTDNSNSNNYKLKSSTCGWKYLEASPNNVGDYPFGGYGNTYSTGIYIGDGVKNTEILKSISNSAAEACSKYSVTTEDGTVYDDWFLPSSFELQKLMLQYPVFANYKLTEGYYWTSSAVMTVYANVAKKTETFGITSSRNNTYRVRAVRRF